MTPVWVDANVLLRLITNDSPPLARRALRLMERAERGEITLRVTWLVISEVVFSLESFYGRPKDDIVRVLTPLLTADGVEAENADTTIDALQIMAQKNVDLVAAYLAALARRSGDPVASFDKDFARLGVETFAL